MVARRDAGPLSGRRLSGIPERARDTRARTRETPDDATPPSRTVDGPLLDRRLVRGRADGLGPGEAASGRVGRPVRATRAERARPLEGAIGPAHAAPDLYPWRGFPQRRQVAPR